MREFEVLLAGFFRAVSFEAGTVPDYEAIRAVFAPRGLLIRAVGAPAEVSTVDEFIAPRVAQVRSGALTAFAESEISGASQVFGNVGQRWSRYDKRGVLDGAAFAAQGWISTQFARTGDGWRITSMAWDDER
ncbi:nuclear transport factor 2 family protein [Dactylosporangium vinaceum]|uniref:Nuclear transport factor 2 family protein n=1 Tax=Dactylosporangium vinaceum TaxID=53362 RepID=A0ABV5MRZ6_9ACTN|nr:nuclear transport factor 2 family protein [Dactylosporangium vinaceum]UAC00330.1 nuclear transport factor 2 family protein [Dactylosporangium vinaceum]